MYLVARVAGDRVVEDVLGVLDDLDRRAIVQRSEELRDERPDRLGVVVHPDLDLHPLSSGARDERLRLGEVRGDPLPRAFSTCGVRAVGPVPGEAGGHDLTRGNGEGRTAGELLDVRGAVDRVVERPP